MIPISFRTVCLVAFVLSLAATPVGAAQPGHDFQGDPLPEGALARMGTTRLRHDDFVSHVVYSPNGKFLASLSHDNTLRVWDAITGQQLHLYLEKDVVYYALAWSPDSSMIAVSGDNPLHSGNAGIRFFDLKAGKET